MSRWAADHPADRVEEISMSSIDVSTPAPHEVSIAVPEAAAAEALARTDLDLALAA
jgi:hypothetical protein